MKKIISIIASLLVLAGCNNDNNQSKKDETKDIGMANPASVYCKELKGTLDLKSGICTLPSGEKIQEWDLYRRDHK